MNGIRINALSVLFVSSAMASRFMSDLYEGHTVGDDHNTVVGNQYPPSSINTVGDDHKTVVGNQYPPSSKPIEYDHVTVVAGQHPKEKLYSLPKDSVNLFARRMRIGTDGEIYTPPRRFIYTRQYPILSKLTDEIDRNDRQSEYVGLYVEGDQGEEWGIESTDKRLTGSVEIDLKVAEEFMSKSLLVSSLKFHEREPEDLSYFYTKKEDWDAFKAKAKEALNGKQIQNHNHADSD